VLEKVSRNAVSEIEIRSGVELPSIREEITLHTEDVLTLVGELALPVGRPPIATILTLHPLPTHGGFMDSHILRKLANRLPALTGVAVLRFNTRGTTSPRGTSEGEFDGGVAEKFDVDAALKFLESRGFSNIWLLGWSFGTELALKYGFDKKVSGAILLSPPLHRTSEAELRNWNGSNKPVIALVPEFDDYLVPEAAVERFEPLQSAQVVAIDGAKHLWVGEAATKSVIDEVVRVVAPEFYPLPTHYRG
jgi:alpha/beta superfamily hydrolase